MKQIYDKTLDYLKGQVGDFKVYNRGKITMFTCPICLYRDEPTANFIGTTYRVHCRKCHHTFGTIIDLVKLLEEDKKDWTDDKVIRYLAEKFDIQYVDNYNVMNTLEFYKDMGFDLVPIMRDGKIPIEKEWTIKEHKDIDEWNGWLSIGNNIGVKTGKISNITVIDIDQMPIPVDVSNLLKEVDTLTQITNKGMHYFFKYEEDLPKTRIDDLKIDIENDGGQVVIYPSKVEGKVRTVNLRNILPMPKEFKEFLKQRIGSFHKVDNIEQPVKENLSIKDLDFVNEGNRTNFLMKFGGILRKELNLSQTSFVINIINNKFIKPPLPKSEFNNILNSLDKYINYDYKDLTAKILNYLRAVGEATARDIKEVTGEKLELVNKALAFLVREEIIIKQHRAFHIMKKAEWKDTFTQDGREVDFKMPYFHDLAYVRDGDLIVIGGKSGSGKTHISMNIVKQLIEQGIKPYYISLESGNRFSTIAQQLKIREGQFYHCLHFSPESIEIEPKAVTIVDWLLPKDYASTDKIYEHFAQQLSKQGGIVIIFCQLRDNGTFFAQDMIKFFPSIVAKFLYDDENGGESSYFITEKVRESKTGRQINKIPCRYIWDTKELLKVE